MKGGVKAAKAASQATSSDRALLPISSQAGRVLGHAHALHTLCKVIFLIVDRPAAVITMSHHDFSQFVNFFMMSC